MAATNMYQRGSKYTSFNFNGKPIAWCEVVNDSGTPGFSDRGQNYEAIQPLGALHPVEIAVSRTIQMGTLQLSIRETWNEPVWNQLAGLEGTLSISDIFNRLRDNPEQVTCTMIITPPVNTVGRKIRQKTYHGCQVVAIQDGDQITVAGMTVAKNITVAYTHYTVTAI